jgi:hypothetical protein
LVLLIRKINYFLKMSYYYPSYSYSQSSASPDYRKRSDSLNISANNIISLNKAKYTPYKLTSSKLNDLGPLDKITNIESKLKNIDDQMDVRTELFNSFLSKSNPNVGIYNPYVGNPVLGMNPNKKIETTKSLAKLNNTNQPKTRLESIEYQNLLQEQLIQQRKEKLQENNFHINNIIFQEIDEMADNLELFKIEMFNHVRKLERNQEKLNMGEVLDELTHMREYFKSTLDRQEKKKDREMMVLKEDIGILRDELTDNLRYETKQNRDLFKQMNNEIRGYQDAMNSRIDDMESRQKIQISGIKNMIKRLKDEDDYSDRDRERRISYERNKKDRRPRYDEEEIPQQRRRGGVIQLDEEPKRREGVIQEEEEEIEFNEEEDNFQDVTNAKDKQKIQREKEKKKEFENLKNINTNNNFK